MQDARGFGDGDAPRPPPQVGKLPVDYRFNIDATAETGLAESPDVVIIATGSHPYVPPLPGLDG